MSERLIIKQETNKDGIFIALTGPIDEDSKFLSIPTKGFEHYFFDFSQVTLINSCGIREWICFIKKLPSTATLHYQNCKQMVIEQINMVHGFIKNGSIIESFIAPYYCSKCEKEDKISLRTNDLDLEKLPPRAECPICHTVMEFDAIPMQYFAFLKQTRKD